ncbi:MAG: hypothetical protein C0489_11610 [Candidatus Accumulibacter sp.]|nr:hypothetical protein [Accumulibacter sp.]
MRHISSAAFVGLVVLSVGGCERREAARPSLPPPSKLAADASDAGLLAAAGPFRILASAAFTARFPVLDQDIARAVAIAEHVKPWLPPDAQRELKTQLDAIAAARRGEDREGIAWASVEIYRLFVSHAPPSVVPREINLLRYAGLRYEADLKAQPVTWGDMVEAAAFGRRAWASVQGRVSDGALRERVSTALDDMAVAAERRDVALALDANRRVLELASLLETATTRR